MDKHFLDIGDGGGVLIRDIVLIIDADTATKSKLTREFLSKNGKSAQMPKKDISRINSFVITDTFGKVKIYSSPVSPNLLKKRANEKINFNA